MLRLPPALLLVKGPTTMAAPPAPPEFIRRSRLGRTIPDVALIFRQPLPEVAFVPGAPIPQQVWGNSGLVGLG